MMKKSLLFFCGVLLSFVASAQIPNDNFELWDTYTNYKSPQGWDNVNALSDALGVHTCERDSSFDSQSYYMKLSSAASSAGVIPGVAVSGKINPSAYYLPLYGIPLASRPHSLSGTWEYMGFWGDEGFVSILLTRWNTIAAKRDTVAYSNYILEGMEMSWVPFSIPIKYYTGDMPDSAIILLSSSGSFPKDMSFLYIDSLLFEGSVPAGAITLNTANTSRKSSAMTIYPNPAIQSTGINYYSQSAGKVTVSISDLNGRIITTKIKETVRGSNHILIDISGIANGMYFVKVAGKDGTEIEKLVIQ